MMGGAVEGAAKLSKVRPYAAIMHASHNGRGVAVLILRRLVKQSGETLCSWWYAILYLLTQIC